MEENCVLLRKYRFVEAAQPYTVISSNPQKICMVAVMAISYVMEENEAFEVERGTAIICYLIYIFRDLETHQWCVKNNINSSKQEQCIICAKNKISTIILLD